MGSATSIIKLSLQSNQYEQKLRGAKRQFEDFTASIGINMKKMTAYGLAAGAAASAINGLTSAISDAVTEGTRMAKEMEGVKAAFSRLNQPNLLNNLREATHGTVNDLELMKQAVKFDNFNLSLEQMGTMLAFAQQQAKDTGQDVGYLVDSIVTGLGRKSLPILDNLGLSATEIRERMKETGDMTKAVAQIIEERMAAAGGYVETAADRAARATTDMQNAMMKLGETFGPITQNSDSLWNSIKIGAINALTYVGNLINYLHEAGRISNTISNMNGGGMMERFGNNLRNSKNPSSLYQRQLAEINRSINSAQAKLQQAEKGGMGSIQIYRERVQALQEVKKKYQELYQTITRPPKPVPTDVKPTVVTKGGGGKGFDIASIAFSAMSDSSMKYDPSQHAQASGLRPENILGPSDEWENYKNVITDSIGGIADEMNNLSFDNFQESYEKVGKDVENLNKTAMQSKMAFGLAANAVSALGGALAGMEDPGAKAAGTVLQALSSIALGFAMASVQAAFLGPLGWIAWAGAGIAALATMISTVHQLTGLAEGGIVGGNQYSGDNIYAGNAMVNSGELVLNKAQQGNLASQLSGNGMQGIKVAGKIKGTDIILSVDRTLQLQGKQLLTWG